jgi:alkaline phosphatase
MKRVLGILLATFFALSLWASEGAAPKYVFYFIGDGMGVNQVFGAAEYNEATGYGPAVINFSQFPVRGFVTTVSTSSLVTDSAAAGTALATGVKTYNSAIGLNRDEQPVSNLSEWAKAAGFGTGVATTVGINHATPASFIAHTRVRGNYEDIAIQYMTAPVDFAAGGGFITEKNSGHSPAYFEDMARNAGIAVLHGPQQFKDIASRSGRVLCLSGKAQNSLPYAIDRREDDTTLSDFVSAGISYLWAHYADKGFFFMVEGGKIDNGGHANDAAACFQELNDFASAIDLALDFYEQHPEETLILVTADHETGGLMLGSGQYEMHPERLAGQHMSMDALTALFRKTFLPENEADYVTPSWEQVKAFFREHLGLWDSVEVDEKADEALQEVYHSIFGLEGNRNSSVENLYSSNSKMVTAAVGYLNKAAGFGWSFGSHSGSPVGLYVTGCGAEAFVTVKDNAQIAPTIARLAGYKR